MIDQTDQTPTVTDDDRRTAYEWAASLDPDMRCWTDRERAAARVIRATVPAPPATLADELRGTVQDLSQVVGLGTFDGLEEAITDIADRVESVEEACAKAQQDAVDAWEHAAQADKDHVRSMEWWGQAYDRVSNKLADATCELGEARVEVERLTVSLNRQCTTVTPSVHNTDVLTASSDTLPDPADVPLGSAYQVSAPVWGTARTLTGVKTGTDRWVVYSPSGETGTRHNSEIELRARLVPEVTA